MRTVPLFKVFMADTAPAAVSKVLTSGFVGQGPQVEAFESKVRAYFNHDYCLSLNSGTSGLHLALHLLKNAGDRMPGWSQWQGLKPGHEVLTTALTCTASNWPILANGLKIKWVDVNPATLNLDYDDLERKITPNTRAIMVVHWGGYPNDIDNLKEIQTKTQAMYGFKPAIIEDCAHAFGSEYKGKKVGTVS